MYKNLKIAVLKQENILHSKHFYRYVDHKNKMATTGFIKKKALLQNSDCIRFDKETVALMKNRYREVIDYE